MFDLFTHLLNNIGYLMAIAFSLTYVNKFKKIIEKEVYSIGDKLLLSILFSSIAILGTYLGAPFHGSIASTRNVGVVVGAIIGGPLVGSITGIIAGLHRYIIDIHGVTSLPCAIASSLGGLSIGLCCYNIKYGNRRVFGIGAGIVVESMSMILILFLSTPNELAKEIVKNIWLPMMLLNGIGSFVVIAITEEILKEKEREAGRQAKMILEIANKTLPHFRELNSNSYPTVCKIIGEALEAEIVAITDREDILASHSRKKRYKLEHPKIMGINTKNAIKNGETIIVDNLETDKVLNNLFNGLKSAIIVPLIDNNGVVGTLKLYFTKNSSLTCRNKNLTIGLSKLISTQLEISRIERLEKEATRAEIRALQAQINPHFLFNALHTISSFVRINPDKARKVIIDLSTYLRYSIETGNRYVSIGKELEQVKAYVGIEEARFYNKFNVHYDIEEGIEKYKIPSLTIQPLVENAIQHGVLKSSDIGNVYISVFKEEDNIQVVVEDDGVGIDEKILRDIKESKPDYKKIGLYNVYSRIKLIYGETLLIEKLMKGTRISFNIKRGVTI